MHVYFSGIGGMAIGPLALIAKQAGFEISGSDKQDSEYITYLKNKGINSIHIGQSIDKIAAVHSKNPIDWLVYSSSVTIENPKHPELAFAADLGIKTSKRDELINHILNKKDLKMFAVAGTHGKTTTTSMAIWLFKQLNIPISYSVGAKISFGDMGQFNEGSEYFLYEADEFDRNFLAFEPAISLITGVSWDHHEIFPTREDYQQAFREFLKQTDLSYVWQNDSEYLELGDSGSITILDPADSAIKTIKLAGHYNRLDAWLVIKAVHKLTNTPVEQLIAHMNDFPGLSRRMEQLAPGLFTDYAHTPEKIRGAMSVALEMSTEEKKDLVVIYEPLTNRRQHYILDDYKNCFDGAKKIYWIPSYQAREDPKQRTLTPEELISRLDDPSSAQAKKQDNDLKNTIQKHLSNGDMVVAMTGGGGGSLDEWLRQEFPSTSNKP